MMTAALVEMERSQASRLLAKGYRQRKVVELLRDQGIPLFKSARARLRRISLAEGK
jgi:hypothetical protein